ncbi:unnamed protein product [Alopecurus aequalis]
MVRSLPMTLLDDVKGGCGIFVVGAVGGSVICFVEGALRNSSKGCRLAAGVQAVITNGPCVSRWAGLSSVFYTIRTGVMDTFNVGGPLNMVVAGSSANALFSMHRGTRAAVSSPLWGAAYSAVASISIYSLMSILESRLSDQALVCLLASPF